MAKLVMQRAFVTLNTKGLVRWMSAPSASKAPAATGGVGVTEACAKRLEEIVGSESGDKSKKFLRVSVEGGGCSGFQYKFLIDDQLGPEDKSFGHPQYSNARVVVDSSSLEYLEGATVDFQTELIRSAFRILQNPKADHGCSCGASFTIKL